MSNIYSTVSLRHTLRKYALKNNGIKRFFN